MKKRSRKAKSPSKYEIEAIKQIHAWKNPKLSWWSKPLEFISKPFDQLSDKAFDTKVGEVLKKTISGLFRICNDTAQWTIRKDTILKEYNKRGYEQIKNSKDIYKLDLEDIDRVIGWLDYKYESLAFTEGGITGATGLPGLAVDIPSLILLNLRAIGEFATYTGYDINLQQERLFALNVLAYASSPSDASKQLALAQLIKISQEVAKKKAWKTLEEYMFVQILQSLAKTIGIRLTKAKLAQFIPISGAIVGAGFNVYYTKKVCDAAFYLYRERYLANKYGADIIERTVKPAKDYNPDYPEVLEPLPS